MQEKIYIVKSTPKGVEPPVERQIVNVRKNVGGFYDLTNVVVDRYVLDGDENPHYIDILRGNTSGIDIAAKSMEEAEQKLAEIIAEDYSSSILKKVEIYEVEQVSTVDFKAIYQKVVKDRIAQKQKDKESKEKAEFERLKSKFGE